MELSDDFEVPHPVDVVWGVITDVERIAPCLPGAKLTGRDGDSFDGLVKVKVGPITSQYTGKASFTERDDDAHRLRMSASGRDSRGAGNASAEITVSLESVDAASTRVSVHTDLTITGKVAQFGRGVLADVSRKLMGQFADNLAALIAADVDSGEADDSADDAEDPPAEDSAGDAEAGATDAPAAPTPAAADAEVEAVDLLGVAGAPVLKRLVPVIVAVVVIVVVVIIAVAA